MAQHRNRDRMRPPGYVSPLRHKGNGAISYKAYVQQKRLALMRSLVGKSPIYLDLKFWIDLLGARDATSGVFSELLELLRRGVRLGRLFCPISESVLHEVQKQSDPITRQATAELIDELSLGVSLMSLEELVSAEMAHLILTKTGLGTISPADRFAFSKIGAVAAYAGPPEFPESPMKRRMIQKAYFDMIWNMSLANLLDTLGDQSSKPKPWAKLASDLNATNKENAAEITSFDALYADEARGALDGLQGAALRVVDEIVQEATGRSPSRRPEDEAVASRLWAGILSAALVNGQARDLLPTLHVHASLHAMVRWDKNRKFKPNDFYDFHHAAGALGHCEVFFTEGPLRSLITAGPCKLAQTFGREVATTAPEAIQIVRGRLADLQG